LNEQVRQALAQDRVIDITTKGRKSGERVRKEIWFHNIDGDIYITGTPGKRDWYANVIANPDFTFHLKTSAEADLDATARPVTEPGEKRAVLERILVNLERAGEIDNWVEDSPLIEVSFSSA
jgi:deazaflavin-dependent oxidoreductase (nitroreductase family)